MRLQSRQVGIHPPNLHCRPDRHGAATLSHPPHSPPKVGSVGRASHPGRYAVCDILARPYCRKPLLRSRFRDAATWTDCESAWADGWRVVLESPSGQVLCPERRVASNRSRTRECRKLRQHLGSCHHPAGRTWWAEYRCEGGQWRNGGSDCWGGHDRCANMLSPVE